jgi:quinolinate synthase
MTNTASERDKPLIDEILRIKELRRAVILSHNYQREEVQDAADFVGDSLELSRKALSADCDVIVFCGVNFMAETASILSPQKTVLLPAGDACCPMADMVTVSRPREVFQSFPGYETPPAYVFSHDFTILDMKKKFPGVPVVAYVNTTAQVKAASDVCCTSANVVKVVESMPGDRVICLPDKNLSAWAAKNTSKEIISWDGFCHVHDRIRAADVEAARIAHPKALFMAHPECRIEVLELADCVTSTSGMLRHAAAEGAEEFIVGTEVGLLHRLRKENPGKRFYPLRKDMVCPNMKRTSLELLLAALRDMRNVVNVPEDVRAPAKRALDRMLDIS